MKSEIDHAFLGQWDECKTKKSLPIFFFFFYYTGLEKNKRSINSEYSNTMTSCQTKPSVGNRLSFL